MLVSFGLIHAYIVVPFVLLDLRKIFDFLDLSVRRLSVGPGFFFQK